MSGIIRYQIGGGGGGGGGGLNFLIHSDTSTLLFIQNNSERNGCTYVYSQPANISLSN